MASAKIEVRLDEELQIVRQRIEGNMDLEDADRIDSQTDECRLRLPDPAAVRILVDAREIGRAAPRVRRRLAANLERPEVRKVAVWGGPPLVRVMVTFFRLGTGRRNLRAFATEEEAIEWLVK